MIRHSHVLFLASFDSNDAFLSQLSVLIMLCESFISSLTIFMPYYPGPPWPPTPPIHTAHTAGCRVKHPRSSTSTIRHRW